MQITLSVELAERLTIALMPGVVLRPDDQERDAARVQDEGTRGGFGVGVGVGVGIGRASAAGELKKRQAGARKMARAATRNVD